MEVLRTPDECFNHLEDYPFDAHYIRVPAFGDDETQSLRMHFVDEGPINAKYVILLIHGEPTWSYLYRKMIPLLAKAGHRVIAPDIIGFGKSDKPTKTSDYTYRRHLKWMKAFVETLNISNIILFGQDWGGLIGLRLFTAPELSNRFCGAVIGNTTLPTGRENVGKGFRNWRDYVKNTKIFDVGALMKRAAVQTISKSSIEAYNAPFPDPSYLAGAREFPQLVPTDEGYPEADENTEAWKVLRKCQKPFLTLFSDKDPIFSGGEKVFQTSIPGAKHQKHTIITGAGHFLQEDQGEKIAALMAEWIRENFHQLSKL